MFDSWPAVSLLQCVREEQLDLHTVKKKVFSQLIFNSLHESSLSIQESSVTNENDIAIFMLRLRILITKKIN